MDDKILIYKFDYVNKAGKILARLIEIICNLTLSGIAAVLLMFIFGSVESQIKDNRVLVIVLSVILTIIQSAITIFFLVLSFMPKKIIICGNAIIVKRYNLDLLRLNRGINDVILIDEIKKCDFCDIDVWRRYRTEPFSIISIKRSGLVEICTNDKQYILQVADSEDFIAEVEIRMGR